MVCYNCSDNVLQLHLHNHLIRLTLFSVDLPNPFKMT